MPHTPSPSSSRSTTPDLTCITSTETYRTVRLPQITMEDIAYLMDLVPSLQHREVTLDLVTGELLIDGIPDTEYTPLLKCVTSVLDGNYQPATPRNTNFDMRGLYP